MYTALVVMTIIMGIGVGWSIGANDAANSLGAAVGARVVSLRKGIVLIAVFGLLGALLQGAHVTQTIGKGIVRLCDMPRETAGWLALAASFAACAWVALATYLKMPVSTSHSIVGAAAGAGLALGVDVNWRVLGGIFVCWVCTPLSAAIVGFVLLKVLEPVFARLVPDRHAKTVLTALIVASGCYVAFSWGANDVANAAGVVVGAGIVPVGVGTIVGGAAIVLGVVTWGYKVIETIGSEITQLLPIMAFAAQLGSALNVHAFTLLGIPVSTSHSIVGAIIGVGLVKGKKVVNVRIMREIAICWVATPFVSGIVSFMVMRGAAAFIHFETGR